MADLLTAQNVRKEFGGLTAVNDVDFTVPEGKIVSLIGPNGAGKTTFFNISVFILCMVILGGMGNIWGVILGAAFLSYLDREGLANTGTWLNDKMGIHFEVPLYASGIYGAIIVLVMLFRPEGLIPDRRHAVELHEGVADEPLYDAAHAGSEA